MGTVDTAETGIKVSKETDKNQNNLDSETTIMKQGTQGNDKTIEQKQSDKTYSSLAAHSFIDRTLYNNCRTSYGL